jgi:hypothetical protein
VLWHPAVGEIDVIWGNRRGGLRHILVRPPNHAAVLSDLPDRFARMEVLPNPNPLRIVLWDPHTATLAVIALHRKGRDQRWLLTAYEKLPSGHPSRGDSVPGSRP